MPTARTPRPSARARATTPALPALLACPLCKGEHLVTPACAVDDRTGAALPLREAIETAHFRDEVLARSAGPFRAPAAPAARSPRRVAARDVRHADGSRSLLPAVDLVRASAVVACRCAACSAPIAARAEYVIASRVVDTTATFDVAYCTADCRSRFVGGAR